MRRKLVIVMASLMSMMWFTEHESIGLAVAWCIPFAVCMWPVWQQAHFHDKVAAAVRKGDIKL